MAAVSKFFKSELTDRRVAMKIPKWIFRGTLVVIIGGPIVTVVDRLIGISLIGNFSSAPMIHAVLFLTWGATMVMVSRN